MKGVINPPYLTEGMNRKPIIACAGDWNLFCTLEAPLVAAIPQDSCEWRRSYGRLAKSVCLEASFVKYNLENTKTKPNLLKEPILYIYWTDCSDIEYYKTSLKDEIETWLKQLDSRGITDWLLVQVETYDARKVNKLLPRTTVLDKMKSDFSSKQTEDRFICVINPIKSESRSAESWRSLVSKIRNLILISYNKAIVKFEEYIREQRERRNDPEWDFIEYFLLQEQLAFVFEMLGLYDEALIQYDELDALFSQFILNSNVSKSPKWLESFKQPITSWKALKLTALVPQDLRDLIINRKMSLLDFRSYLFQRQSAMLLLKFQPWEIASRCTSMVHNTMAELSLLGVSSVEGAAACWAHLACAETLRALKRLSSSNETLEMCTAMQAPLLHDAKLKLHELGKLCGLLPGSPNPTSEQLHLVVMLSSGMGDSENGQEPTPMDKLKEALCSKLYFQQYYLELAEMAMGTYKHIGRQRFAQLIGRELAAFYLELGESSKAVVFLTDALRSYEEQGWRDLAAQTRLELVAAAKKMNDIQRYTKLCATIASTVELEVLVREFYFNEMMKSIKENLSKSDPVLAELNDCFKIISVNLIPSDRGVYITNNKVQCRLNVESLLPNSVNCKVSISIEHYVDDQNIKKTPIKNKTDLPIDTGFAQNMSPKMPNEPEMTEVSKLVSSINLEELKPKNPFLNRLYVTSELQYKEDKTLQKAIVECHCATKKPLRRSDSTKYRKPSITMRKNFLNNFTSNNISIQPGSNELVLDYYVVNSGKYKLGQVSILAEEKIDFLSEDMSSIGLGFEAVTQGVTVSFDKLEPKKDLLTGVEQEMVLLVSSGGTSIAEGTSILLKTSTGLSVRFADEQSVMAQELRVPVAACNPFETTRTSLCLFSAFQPKKEKSVEHTVYLSCPWWEKAIEVPLVFSPPLIATWRLYTAHARKYVHVALHSSVAHLVHFALTEPKLECDGNNLLNLNPANIEDMMVASDGTTCSFMWELLKDPLGKGNSIKATFSVNYTLLDSKEPARVFTYCFKIQDYTTLFVIRTKLEPSKGIEFCRASQVCCLHLTIQRINETEYTSLMYEVLADQSMWAVLNRTAGVVNIETTSIEAQCVTLEVMPLISGYLPLPTVRLSKYIAANTKDPKKDISSHPRLEPFSPGQVYHADKAQQVHVLPSITKEHVEPPL